MPWCWPGGGLRPTLLILCLPLFTCTASRSVLHVSLWPGRVVPAAELRSRSRCWPRRTIHPVLRRPHDVPRPWLRRRPGPRAGPPALRVRTDFPLSAPSSTPRSRLLAGRSARALNGNDPRPSLLVSTPHDGDRRPGTVACRCPGSISALDPVNLESECEAELFHGYFGDRTPMPTPFTLDGWFRTGASGELDQDGLRHHRRSARADHHRSGSCVPPRGRGVCGSPADHRRGGVARHPTMG